MSSPTNLPRFRAGLNLQFPMSLGVYDEYEQAQKAVDYLSDNHFPVENCMIVGTDLKQVERVTGRLTTGRVALGGALSGLWLGLFVGLIFSLFGTGNGGAIILSTALFGVIFGLVWALVGYAATRGHRDFTSISQVVATRYEVLVEHKYAEEGRRMLSQLGGSNPFTDWKPAGSE
ncbi:MAG: general stress protein [Nocardioidaceae bacterium]